jgi:3-oxoacyl-[acyl-carrier protein] reductase
VDFGIAGRTALVLGSTGGLGHAVAQRLAEENVNVVVTGRRGERARDVASQWPGSVGLEVDLMAPDVVEHLVKKVQDTVGSIDILVLNSPGPPPAPATDVNDAQIATAIQTLLLRQVDLVRAVLPGMRSQKWGRIVGIGSSGIQAPLPNLALSNTGRAALAAYLKTLAAETAADGVTVNMVLPGRIATDRLASLDQAAADRQGISSDEVARRSAATIPAGRYGRPEEFADAAVFLASDRAGYVTGVQLRVDGGLVRGF